MPLKHRSFPRTDIGYIRCQKIKNMRKSGGPDLRSGIQLLLALGPRFRGGERKKISARRVSPCIGRFSGRLARRQKARVQAAVAAGSAAGGAISEKLRGDVEALARNLGDAIADKVIEYAITQGWVQKPA